MVKSGISTEEFRRRVKSARSENDVTAWKNSYFGDDPMNLMPGAKKPYKGVQMAGGAIVPFGPNASTESYNVEVSAKRATKPGRKKA